ncbi:MAG: ABC transporter ATP-binding protein [Hyphomicrobiales bacterium]
MLDARPIAIRVKGLEKRFANVHAVRGLDFEVRKGEIAGLLGGNGAGKTTTIGMLLGLVAPTAGSMQLLGVDVEKDRHHVQHLLNFESPYVDMPLRLTVRQNLTVYGKLYGVRGLKDRIAELAEALDLVQMLERPTGKLSAGQKTRVSLAKSLINSPRLLLLDEPTASLDPDTADWVRGHLERYCREGGATMLLASHNMGEVERLCDEVLIMKEGLIVDRDPPGTLLKRYGRANMEEVFLDVARDRGIRAREIAGE